MEYSSSIRTHRNSMSHKIKHAVEDLLSIGEKRSIRKNNNLQILAKCFLIFLYNVLNSKNQN